MTLQSSAILCSYYVNSLVFLLACLLSRKGNDLTSWLLLIAITIWSSKCKIIMKAGYCGAKINRRLVLLRIRENFSAKMLDKVNYFPLENNPL